MELPDWNEHHIRFLRNRSSFKRRLGEETEAHRSPFSMQLRSFIIYLVVCTAACIAKRAAKIAPLYVPPAAKLLDDSYIVVLKSDIPERLFNAHMSLLEASSRTKPVHGVDSGLEHVFDNHIIRGYSGKFSKEVIEMIRMRPEVDYVEQDQIMRVAKTQDKAPWVNIHNCLF